jgi:hypothetical protein
VRWKRQARIASRISSLFLNGNGAKMAVVDPIHLLEQADRLVQAPAAGAPRQADLRRAISSSYYAVFHFTAAALADEFVGRTQRNSPRYAAIYRSLDHGKLKSVCIGVPKSTPSSTVARLVPANGFGDNVIDFAATIVQLQEERHRADYDPSYRVRTSDARVHILAARRAIRRYQRANTDRKKAFLTLLLAHSRAA